MNREYWLSFRRVALWLGLAVAVLQLPDVQAVIPTGWGPAASAFVAVAGLLMDWLRHHMPGGDGE